MSELKARYVVDDTENPFGELSQVYLKSEADKVIADRDKEIAKLKDSIGKLLKSKTEQVMDEVFERCLIYGEGFVPVEHAMRLVAELRHYKYKRCLTMAKWCESEAHKYLTQQGALVSFQDTDRFQYLQRNFMHFGRWHKRWLKIAKKFNEEK